MNRLHARPSKWQFNFPGMNRLQTVLLESIGYKSKGGGGTYPIVSSLGSIPDSEISRNPSDTGSENRRGPALPGLK